MTHHHDGIGTHEHDHPATNHDYGPSRDGTVVLDIGGEIGALVLLTGPELLGAEIEVSPVGEDDRRTHVAVRERLGAGGSRYAAIYPSLPQGEYTLWRPDDTADGIVRVTGGEVAQADWR